jgi:hypothetical protein
MCHLELTFAGSLVAPSMESRTRRSPNFGETNIVSRSLFLFGIFDTSVLLELVNRLPKGASNLVQKEKSKGRSWELICTTHVYRTRPVLIPDTSGIGGHSRFCLTIGLTLCCRVVASVYIFYTPCLLCWLTCEGLFL